MSAIADAFVNICKCLRMLFIDSVQKKIKGLDCLLRYNVVQIIDLLI